MSQEPELAAPARVILLYCQHCVAAGADVAQVAAAARDMDIEPVLMPCSSKVQVFELLKLLDEGADAVQVVACPERACRFLDGSRRAEKRVQFGRGLLDQINLGSERLGISRATNLTAEALVDIARARGHACASTAKEGE